MVGAHPGQYSFPWVSPFPSSACIHCSGSTNSEVPISPGSSHVSAHCTKRKADTHIEHCKNSKKHGTAACQRSGFADSFSRACRCLLVHAALHCQWRVEIEAAPLGILPGCRQSLLWPGACSGTGSVLLSVATRRRHFLQRYTVSYTDSSPLHTWRHNCHKGAPASI